MIPAELESLTSLVLRGDAIQAEIDEGAAAARETIARIDSPSARLALEAQVLFLLAFADRGAGRANQAEARLEAAVEVAQESVRTGATSEAHRILSDIYNQLLDMRGVAYKARHFRKAWDNASIAVELDPSNASAHLSAAGYLISAPGIAGGDVASGLRHVETARTLAGDSPRVVFFSGIWAATAAVAQNRGTDAEAELLTAASVYPDNWWLSDVASTLGISIPRDSSNLD